MTKRKTGTREWSDRSENIQVGCEYGCRYCYARLAAVQHQLCTWEGWTTPRLNERKVRAGRRFVRGTIMFPTTHDITPANREQCMRVLVAHLAAGNSMLLVTKAHAGLVDRLRESVDPSGAWRERLELRFTIGTLDFELANYWEPGAPPIVTRFAELAKAWAMGFRTSVSMEPCLDLHNAPHVVGLADPYVSGEIWIGLMNRIRDRVRIETHEDEQRVAEIEREQRPDRVRAVYELLKDHPKVRWKDSIQKLLGVRNPETVRGAKA